MTRLKLTLGSVGRIFLGVMAGIAVFEAVLLIVCLKPSVTAAPVQNVRHRSAIAQPTRAAPPDVCTPEQIAESNRASQERDVRVSDLSRTSRLIQTDAKGLEQWETSQGTYWIPKGDSNSLFQVLAEQEGGIYRVPEVGVHRGDIVLDVGASFGAFVRKALAEGAAKVVAIDPAPEVIECLRRNLADEIAAGKVLVVEKGAWDRDDSLTMDLSPGYTIAAHINDKAGPRARPNEVTVPLTTIDKMVAELHLKKVDFIKMDIEGAEERALPGSTHTIARFRPRMAICVYHKPHHPVLLSNIIRGMVPGYRQKFVCHNFQEIRPEVSFFW